MIGKLFTGAYLLPHALLTMHIIYILLYLLHKEVRYIHCWLLPSASSRGP